MTALTLYHFQQSPFSRRVRLALAHKGLSAELHEGRTDPASHAKLRELVPFRTIPVLLAGDLAMGDSSAITHWLDAAYPKAPRLWPTGSEAADALQVTTLVDLFLNTVIDVGTRYYALRNDPSWPAVTGEMLGRAKDAANALAKRVGSLGRATIAPSGWSAADIWLLTMTLWVEGWPSRVTSSQNIAQLMTLGVELPRALSTWADAHRSREDVKALG